MKKENEGPEAGRDRVIDWIDARIGRSVQVEVAASCGREGVVFNGVAIEGVDEESALGLIDSGGEPRGSIAIPSDLLESEAGGSSLVLHLELEGLCVHIWDSDLVMADFERRGLKKVGP